MKYGWATGSRAPSGADPEEYGAEIERLREANGGLLTAHDVLDAAKKKRSPLHAWFEWDNTKAADKYRLAQAGNLLRVLVKEPEDGEQKFRPVRAFVTVGDTTERAPKTYTSIDAAMADPALAAQVVERAKNELVSWRRRFEAVKEFRRIHDAIDGLFGKDAAAD